MHELAIITMVQQRDFPAAWSSLSCLGNQLSPTRRRIVLLNDERSPDLEAALNALSHTTVLTPGRNLGVAVGRNTLLRAAIAAGASHVVTLDDDLYVPSDYLDRIERFLADASETLGIVAPTVLSFTSFARANPDLIDADLVRAGRLPDSVASDDLRARIDPSDAESFYHIGVRDWKSHYLTPNTERGRNLDEVLAKAGIMDAVPRQPANFLRSDPAARELAADVGTDGPQMVDTLPGGVSVLSTSMLDDIGLCDERYSPFGYEDADLCIRARQAGYEVAWMPSTVVLHDFLDRADARSSQHLAFIGGRAKALLAANHAPNHELPAQVARSMSSYLVDANAVLRHRTGRDLRPEQVVSSIAAFASGFLDGATARAADRPALLDRLATLSGGQALAVGHDNRWIVHRLPLGRGDMASVLSAEVSVGAEAQTMTSAAITVSFSEGTTLRVEGRLTHDSAADPTLTTIHHLSLSVEGTGAITRRVYAMLDRSRDPRAARLLRGMATPRPTMLGRTLLGLLSPNCRPQMAHVRLSPQTPATLEEIANTPMDTATGIARLGLSAAVNTPRSLIRS